jgi:hypothetical protein
MLAGIRRRGSGHGGCGQPQTGVGRGALGGTGVAAASCAGNSGEVYCAGGTTDSAASVRRAGNLSAARTIVYAMTSSDRLLAMLSDMPEIDLLLRSSFGFDIHRKHYGEG